MPRAPAAEEAPSAAELGAMPTTTTLASTTDAPAAPPADGGDSSAELKARLGAAAEVAKVQGRKLADLTAEGAKKGLEVSTQALCCCTSL